MKVNTENNRNKIKVFIIKVPQCSFPLPNQNKDLTTEGRFNPMPSLALGYLGGFLRKYGGDYLDSKAGKRILQGTNTAGIGGGCEVYSGQ